jgi:hypothetical protein
MRVALSPTYYSDGLKYQLQVSYNHIYGIITHIITIYKQL